MSFQSLRQISERYANDGNRQDIDEFRSEMNRISRLQRFQTIERYINDLYADYPYLVRNRQLQFVPVRNQRLSELIQIATAQQLEAYNAQAAQQAQAEKDAQARLDAINAAAAAAKQQASSVVPDVSKNLSWLLVAAAGLLALLLIVLVYMVWQVLTRPSPTVTVVRKTVDEDFPDDIELTGSAQ